MYHLFKECFDVLEINVLLVCDSESISLVKDDKLDLLYFNILFFYGFGDSPHGAHYNLGFLDQHLLSLVFERESADQQRGVKSEGMGFQDQTDEVVHLERNLSSRSHYQNLNVIILFQFIAHQQR